MSVENRGNIKERMKDWNGRIWDGFKEKKNLGLSRFGMNGVLKSQESLQTCSRKGCSLTAPICFQMREHVRVGYGYIWAFANNTTYTWCGWLKILWQWIQMKWRLNPNPVTFWLCDSRQIISPSWGPTTSCVKWREQMESPSGGYYKGVYERAYTK